MKNLFKKITAIAVFSFVFIYEKKSFIIDIISSQKKITIAIKLPKLSSISKFKSFNSFILIKFLNIIKCPLEDTGIGSVKPCIIARNKYFINVIILSP